MFKCPIPVSRVVEGMFGRKKIEESRCGKPVAHLFYINNAYHASCEEHWDGKVGFFELEDLE